VQCPVNKMEGAMLDNPRHATSTTVECLDKTKHSFSFSPSSIGGEGHI